MLRSPALVHPEIDPLGLRGHEFVGDGLNARVTVGSVKRATLNGHGRQTQGLEGLISPARCSRGNRRLAAQKMRAVGAHNPAVRRHCCSGGRPSKWEPGPSQGTTTCFVSTADETWQCRINIHQLIIRTCRQNVQRKVPPLKQKLLLITRRLNITPKHGTAKGRLISVQGCCRADFRVSPIRAHLQAICLRVNPRP